MKKDVGARLWGHQVEYYKRKKRDVSVVVASAFVGWVLGILTVCLLKGGI